ncbi:diguanylate cyclase domain-containing protein [Sphingomonas alpina]|uniref:Diguanylate cyclase n=1 Tax=Sphingomonas alpina TaxID=653931 RepID=A0A7H0LLD6_9SPHN|nr:diguanylate cyclase [Sphingomonas alpina]QNQ10489.1 diguanylate cyclase [Sphingomonas alpina]
MTDPAKPAPSKPLPTLRQVLTRVHFRVTLFAVGIAGLTVLLTGFTAVGLYAKQNLKLIAQTASYSVAPAIIFNDAEAAQRSIAPLTTTDGIAEITVSTGGGRVLAQWKSPTGPAPFLSLNRIVETLYFTDPTVAPVVHEGATIGEVRVRGQTGIIAGYIEAGLLGTLACLVVTAVATFLLALHLQGAVIAPLRAIAAVAHAVRVDRAFDRRAPKATILEVDTLRDDFNALLAELEQWQHRLRYENETLSHRATHDALTGLPNRALFDQQLAAMLDQANREGASFAVLYADGDGFKQINDRFGHAAGDVVLAEIGVRLRASLSTHDLAARLGGDEFALLLASPSDLEAVMRVRESITAAMIVPIDLPSGERISVSLSIGAAVYPQDGADVAALVHHADSEMFVAKRSTR